MTDGPMDDIFDEIHKAVDPEINKQLKQVRWEEAMVKRLLRFYGLSQLEPSLRTLCHDATGEDRLQFCWFMYEYPDFPVWLTAEKVPFSFDMRFTQMVRQGLKLKVFELMEQNRDQAPSYWNDAGQPVGLVFELLHTGGRGAMWVAHDCYRPARRRAFRYLVEDPLARTSRFFVLDSFEIFLESLQWEPSARN